ncbi:MAG: caspase family protein [Ferruginibacter sp.]
MRKRYFLLFLFPLFVGITAHAQIFFQDIYEIKFGTTEGKKSGYSALLIRNSHGKDQLRIRYTNENDIVTIYEVPFSTKEDDFGKASANIPPVIIAGKKSPACYHVYLNCFASGKYNPKKKGAVIYKDGRLLDVNVNSINVLRREDLSRELVQQYFLEDESFYTSLFDKKKLRKNIVSTPWFYFINVGNTVDTTIGKGCEKDLDNTTILFRRIAQELDMHLSEIQITGETFTKQNVLNAIAGLEPKQQDVVFFYYTGHGFSFKDDSVHRFPQLDLRSNPPVYSESVIKASTKNIDEIFESIKAKGAHFNLVLSDCCNSLIEFYRRKPNKVALPREGINNPINKIVLANLFQKRKVSILLAAADKAQYAVSDDSYGGIFTFNFNNKMIASLYGTSNDPTWESLITLTNNTTVAMSKTYACEDGKACLQEPIFKIVK